MAVPQRRAEPTGSGVSGKGRLLLPSGVSRSSSKRDSVRQRLTLPMSSLCAGVPSRTRQEKLAWRAAGPRESPFPQAQAARTYLFVYRRAYYSSFSHPPPFIF